MHKNQKGVVPLLLLVAGLGVVAFIILAGYAPFKDNLYSVLYRKSDSYAATAPEAKTYVMMNIGQAQPTVDRINEMVLRLGRGSDGQVKVGFADLSQYLLEIDPANDYQFKDQRTKKNIDTAVAANVPFFFHLFGANPFYSGSPDPTYSLYNHMTKDPNNLEWDQDNKPYIYDFKDPSGATYKSVTYSQLNTEFYKYKKRNLQQAVAKILEWTSQEPAKSLFAGVGLDPEIHLDTWNMPGKIYDYNPKAVGEFRLWLCGDCGEILGLPANQKLYMQGGKYAGKAKNMTLAQINSQFKTNFQSWAYVDPPRPAGGVFDKNDPWWNILHEFRVLMIKHMMQDQVDCIIEAGIPGDKIFTHQVPGAYAVGETIEIKFATPIETAEVTGANTGISIYGNVTTNQSMYDWIIRKSPSTPPRWGIMEFNPVNSDYAINKKALDTIYARGVKVVAPFQWDYNAIGDNPHTIRNTPFEKAIADFVKEHSAQ